MFRLEIDTSNAAFDYPDELSRIVRGVARTIEDPPLRRTKGGVRDMNGNLVGRWEFVPDLEQEEDEEWEVTCEQQ